MPGSARRAGHRSEAGVPRAAERFPMGRDSVPPVVPRRAPHVNQGAARAPGSARERRIATLLFADIVGFTGLNEAHDPELVQAWVARAFDGLSDEVGRYEGLVEKFAGDAMLALFGVPRL